MEPAELVCPEVIGHRRLMSFHDDPAAHPTQVINQKLIAMAACDSLISEQLARG